MFRPPAPTPALALILSLAAFGLARSGAAQDAAAAYARGVARHQAGDLEGAVRAYGEAVALDPRKAQLLLAFGSFTCPQFRHGAPVLNDLYRRFHEGIAFRLVYIREAHPQGEWQSTINTRQG